MVESGAERVKRIPGGAAAYFLTVWRAGVS
jgi:hypothetical protein